MAGQVLLLLSAAIYTVYGQDPIVKIPETQPRAHYGVIQVERDTDVTMSCYVENKQRGTMVRWNKEWWVEKDGSKLLNSKKVSEDTSVEDNTRYSIEKPTQFKWRLRIKSIQISDEGEYVCFVYTTIDNRKEEKITVTVGVSPYFDPAKTSSDTVVKQGDNVDLLCNATGRPHPTIMWSRIGNALLPIGKEIHYEPKLSILNVRPEDRGKYMCMAFNTIGRKDRIIRRQISLDVRFPPIVTTKNVQLKQALGYVIELLCLVESNPYPPEEGGLMWVKGARIISNSIGRHQVKSIRGAFNKMSYELIINGVEESDYGTYKCQIKNSEGRSDKIIELSKTSVPQPSVKLGRVIKAGATTITITMATIVMCLSTVLIQYL
jgi:hypothetical protein